MSCEIPTSAEVKAAREAAGLTQAAAAQLVCADIRTWQRWEGGERKMGATAWKLFRTLRPGHEGGASHG